MDQLAQASLATAFDLSPTQSCPEIWLNKPRAFFGGFDLLQQKGKTMAFEFGSFFTLLSNVYLPLGMATGCCAFIARSRHTTPAGWLEQGNAVSRAGFANGRQNLLHLKKAQQRDLGKSKLLVAPHFYGGAEPLFLETDIEGIDEEMEEKLAAFAQDTGSQTAYSRS